MKGIKKVIKYVVLFLVVFIATKSFALEATYKGFNVIGRIQIPKTSINYYILEKVTQASIEQGIAKLYGVGINEPGNAVLIGHNYRNGLFFSNNKNLEIGDEIYITGMNDVTEKYVVYNKFETTPEDTSFYQIDTNGEKVITLTTTTDDTTKRLIVQAKSTGTVDANSIPVIQSSGTSEAPNSGTSSSGTSNTLTGGSTTTSLPTGSTLGTNTSNLSTNSNINKENVVATNKNIPSTGISNNIIILITIISICGIVFFIKSRKSK